MKIKSKSKNKRVIILLTIIVLLIGSSAAIFAISRSTTKQTTQESSQRDTSPRRQTPDQPSKDNSENKSQSPYSDKPIDPNTEDSSSTKKRVNLVASVDKSDDIIFIRGGFNYPITEGSCYAQLSGPTGQSIRKDTTLLQNPGSTDCKTISIPFNELATGNWKFTLYYTSNNYEGASGEISFTI
jgi:hypothetical protein